MTREEWKDHNRKRRIESNYPKPIILEKNYDSIKLNPFY